MTGDPDSSSCQRWEIIQKNIFGDIDTKKKKRDRSLFVYVNTSDDKRLNQKHIFIYLSLE